MSQALAGGSGPGQSWAYDAMGSRWINTMPDVVKAAVGEDACTVFKSRLHDPLGLSSAFKWAGCDRYWAGEAFGTCRDYARLGQLILNKGAWKGESKPLVTADYIKEMTTPQTKFAPYTKWANPCYGLLTWLNPSKAEYPGTCTHAVAYPADTGSKQFLDNGSPTDVSMFLGMNGEVTLVMPSQNAVVVSMGTTRSGEVVESVYRGVCKVFGTGGCIH